MDKIILYDTESFEILDVLYEKLVLDNTKAISLEKANNIELFSNYNTDIYIFSSTKYYFISNELFSFVEFCVKNNLTLKLNVILFIEKNETIDIISNWFNKASLNYNLSFNIVSQIPKDKWKNNLDLIISSIHLKKQLSFNFENSDNKILTEEEKLALIKNSVTIYTDGACSGNPGAGGYGAILIHGEKRKEISGFDPLTTNNKMEMMAVIKALSMLKQRCNVELYSDSAYVVNAINLNWLENWKKNGWKSSDKKEVKNIELWKELDSLISYHNVKFIKVKGHSDNELNNRCDELATSEIARNTNLD